MWLVEGVTVAPGSYGFGPQGCKSCDCNSIGALDNFCNATTGAARGHLRKGVQQMSHRIRGFPNCERCDCNGTRTLVKPPPACIDCRDNTQGDHCDFCVDSYYGDPRINVDIPCRPCPCPGPPGSNHYFANRCALDPTTKDVICECKGVLRSQMRRLL
ncbi:hypothetical protein NQ318_002477 [Aromia moschata]|uniref:Laminin EGF-like domain-containing protein n=1 Tax=Aromia moschata TaxID=1265417 RepID=A0AAV8Y831_9CUCU|nr:hypothetical protein NQ318_002477 [Aromia moschata]